MTNKINHTDITPPTMRILPIEGIVPLPHIIFPVVVREDPLHQLIQDALKSDKIIAVFTKMVSEDPDADDNAIYDIGVACS
ncbi:MAG: LON peptidase substrate-binding domain-containing protein, partial [Candidatus Marinimicrobia bacterium]|nr:LON peptidase substrate-binding domain-containing protein [Candidatus Neomarinimicrobiota bacterium]